MTADRIPPVPMCDIKTQYRSLQTEIEDAVLQVMRSGQVILGPEVSGFETEVADYCGVAHAVGCSSGSDALSLALAALDIGPGDEVIIPPFTFFATVGAVIRTGATPVFADIDPLTYNLDPEQFARAITPRTRAVIPVHLFGQSADIESIMKIAEQHDIYVIEDAAQGFGAEQNGRRAGSRGHINCFSFYPSKNLSTLGDAGLITTDNERLYKKLLALRNHGSDVKYFHQYIGWNGRLDAIHAAILRVKLPYIDGWIASRQNAAAIYDEMIEDSGLHGFYSRPHRDPLSRHTFNQYTVRVPAHSRNGIMEHLRSAGVSCDVYYPLGLHLQECLSSFGYSEGDFPVTEAASETVMSLPIYPEITEAQQRRVIETSISYLKKDLRLFAA